MKKIVAMLVAATVSAGVMASTASADVFVNGYLKGNGTYVQPHFRSSPDAYLYNNYSFWN